MKKFYAALLFSILISFKTDAQYFMQAAGGVVIERRKTVGRVVVAGGIAEQR